MVSRQKTLRALTGTRSVGQRDGDLAEKQKSTTGNPSLREVIMRLIVRRIRRTSPVVHKPVGREGARPSLHAYIIPHRGEKVNIQIDDF